MKRLGIVGSYVFAALLIASVFKTFTAPKDARTVYVREGGERYHLFSQCAALAAVREDGSFIPVREMKEPEAEKEGRALCAVCEESYLEGKNAQHMQGRP